MTGVDDVQTPAVEVWARATATAPEPPLWLVLGAAALALAGVLSRPVWPRLRHLVTIAHEGAHGVAAALTGRRLRGIRLHSDTSGVAVSSGPVRGPGMVLTAAAGYPGPALVGLGAAALLAAGRPAAVLWVVLAALALLLVQIRNWFGLWSVLVTGTGVLAVTWWAPPLAQSAAAHLLTWFLLLAAPRPVAELSRARRSGRARDSDADQLARLTPLPGGAWVALFALVCLAALGLGGSWLLRAASPG